jgi:hypothetical protein
MINHIHVRHYERIAFHGGARLRNPDSKHFAILPSNVEQGGIAGIYSASSKREAGIRTSTVPRPR